MSVSLSQSLTARGGGTTAELNRVFGKFAYSELAGGAIRIDPTWTAQHIISVPTHGLVNFPPTPVRKGFVQLQAIGLHHLVAPAFLAAWDDLDKQGLTKMIHTFDGSFVPRHMLWLPRNPLSVHSWGAAFDINVASNQYGQKPTLDRRVVAVFERRGFTWGGRWRVPDGMHFQFTRPLPATNPGFTPR